MPITAEQVGRSFPPPKPYEVSRAKIAEFARALGDDNPAYSGDDPVAPPTFVAIIAAQAWDGLFADEELGLALHRTIHADQRFEWVRPLRAGDVVEAQLAIEKVRNRGALDMVTVAVELAVGGERVCTARSTLWHTREEEAA